MVSNQTTISEVQFFPVKPKDGLLGFVSFVVDDKFWMGSIAIFTRLEGGYRLVYPTRKVGGQNINIFHPINRDVSLQVETAVIKKVEQIFNEDYESTEPTEKMW
jgi:stage V sporulation protein G